ncbi:hypothetical protein, partial [Klebsiella pneumoniae]|uniref:hypothetical protein n=1 Tax=Klebsiella pneumoniae TaxID=573 RepID=UPI0021622FB0
MMSLWDALRMNMMISYQELVRTFPNQGWFVEYGAVAAPLPVCHPFMPASLSFLLPEDIHIRSAKKKPTFRYGSELLFSRKGSLWVHNP